LIIYVHVKSGDQRYVEEFLVPAGPMTLVDCTQLLPEACLTPGGLTLAEVQAIAFFGYSQACWT